jgi:hypothetical protein
MHKQRAPPPGPPPSPRTVAFSDVEEQLTHGVQDKRVVNKVLRGNECKVDATQLPGLVLVFCCRVGAEGRGSQGGRQAPTDTYKHLQAHPCEVPPGCASLPPFPPIARHELCESIGWRLSLTMVAGCVCVSVGDSDKPIAVHEIASPVVLCLSLYCSCPAVLNTHLMVPGHRITECVAVACQSNHATKATTATATATASP